VGIPDIERFIVAHMLLCHKLHCNHKHHRHRAHSIRFTFNSIFSGDNMQATLVLGKSPITVIGSPVLSDGVTPSLATLSSTSYVSSDPTVFTVAADPATPNGAIITAVGVGAATLTETATATEPDGTTTETIQGVATITVTSGSSAPGVAASLVFTFGVQS
jgi:hypothetical protein